MPDRPRVGLLGLMLELYDRAVPACARLKMNLRRGWRRG